MAIANKIAAHLSRSSWIRKMFEEGERLRHEHGADKVFDFTLGNPDLEPPEAFKKALRELANNPLPGMHRYMNNAGYLETRAAVAARLARESGLPVQAEQVVMTCGAGGALNVVLKSILNPGEEVIILAPYFVEYKFYIDNHGGVPVEVWTDRKTFRLDLTAIERAITPKTRAIIINSPNNPTGTIYTREAFDAFLGRLPGHVLLVLDEAYFEFVTDDAYPDGLAYFDGERPIAVLRTFSKIYSLAGLRVGYGFVPEPLRHAIDCIREPFNVNSVGQAGALASLDCQAEVERRRQENQEQKTYLYSGFDRLGIEWVPSETNFVWVKTERPVEVFEGLLAEGVIVRPFGSTPALRVGVGTPEESRRTIEAFEAVIARLGGV